jgi:predicted DNA-binding protein (MmcQ/YjbR family)
MKTLLTHKQIEDYLLAKPKARLDYPFLPGYHLNKKHWNTVILSGQLTQQEVFDLIDHSYNLVVQPQE